jgi:hypothetical protein
VDRWLSYALYVLAIGCGCAAVILALSGFVEFLQTGRWPSWSVLDLAYELRLVPMGWLRANRWVWPVFDVLRVTPVALVAVALTPLLWWAANRLARR